MEVSVAAFFVAELRFLELEDGRMGPPRLSKATVYSHVCLLQCNALLRATCL